MSSYSTAGFNGRPFTRQVPINVSALSEARFHQSVKSGRPGKALRAVLVNAAIGEVGTSTLPQIWRIREMRQTRAKKKLSTSQAFYAPAL
jgi:hypothetical protein